MNEGFKILSMSDKDIKERKSVMVIRLPFETGDLFSLGINFVDIGKVIYFYTLYNFYLTSPYRGLVISRALIACRLFTKISHKMVIAQ